MMKFIHIRDQELLRVKRISLDPEEYEMKKGPAQRGGVTLAYDLSILDSSAVISLGASYCSPTEMYCRKTGLSISSTRLLSQPLHFSIGIGDDASNVPKSGTIASMFHVFLLEKDKTWSPLPEPLHPRFKYRWGTEFIGPDGRVVSAAIDSRTGSLTSSPMPMETRTFRSPSQLALAKMSPEVRPLGWLESTPGWLLPFLQRVGQ